MELWVMYGYLGKNVYVIYKFEGVEWGFFKVIFVWKNLWVEFNWKVVFVFFGDKMLVDVLFSVVVG